ncbi:hypothetical protein D3C76_1689840 [compost metagenome]
MLARRCIPPSSPMYELSEKILAISNTIPACIAKLFSSPVRFEKPLENVSVVTTMVTVSPPKVPIRKMISTRRPIGPLAFHPVTASMMPARLSLSCLRTW